MKMNLLKFLIILPLSATAAWSEEKSEVPPNTSPGNAASNNNTAESVRVDEADYADTAREILARAKTEEALLSELEELRPGLHSYFVVSTIFRKLTGVGKERNPEKAKSVLGWLVNSGILPSDEMWTNVSDLITDYGEWEPDNAMALLASYEADMPSGEFESSMETMVEYYLEKHKATEKRILDVARKSGFSNDATALFQEFIAEKRDEE